MANQEHLEILKQGVDVWNKWRDDNPKVRPDLSDVDLPQIDFTGANLTYSNLKKARLNGLKLCEVGFQFSDLEQAELRNSRLERAVFEGARLVQADLTGAICDMALFDRSNLKGAFFAEASMQGTRLDGSSLVGAQLKRADLTRASLADANLQGANLEEATLSGATLVRTELRSAFLVGAKLDNSKLHWANLFNANLKDTNLQGAQLIESNLFNANLEGANLQYSDMELSVLVKTNLRNADLTGCMVYGVSAWDLDTEGAEQRDLRVTKRNDPTVTLDNLKVAQFIHLLLNNEEIKYMVDTVTSKVVLILGSFAQERKTILDAIRDRLRERDLVPVICEFDRPADKDFTGTVALLARMARFIMIDLSDPKCSPHEFRDLAPQVMVPFVPIIERSQKPYGMMNDLYKYWWVLELFKYDDRDGLLSALDEKLIPQVNEKRKQISKHLIDTAGAV